MRRVLAIVVTAVIVAMAAGCSASATVDSSGREGPVATDQAEVERVAGVRLPATAELVKAQRVGFQDSQVWAVFRMPATELDGFLSAAKLPAPEPGLRVADEAFGAIEGVDPKAAVKVSGINQYDTQSPEGYYRKMMFDLDKPGEVTTYLVAVMP